MKYEEQPTNIWDYILISNLILDDLHIDDVERKARLDDLRTEVLEKYSQKDVQLFDALISLISHVPTAINRYYDYE